MRLPTIAKTFVVLGAALLLAACGRVERLTDSEEAQADAVARGALFSADLRLLGGGSSDLEALFLAARDLEVTANGQPVFVSYGHPLFDLSESSNAWLVGRFDVPKGVTELHVKLRLDDYGAFAGPAGAGEVAARGAPLEFDCPVSSLAVRKHAVLHLDLAQSLSVKGSEAQVLTPSFTVNY